MELGGSFQKLKDGVCRFDGILGDGYSTGRGSVCTESSDRVRKVGDQMDRTGSRDAGRGGDSLFSRRRTMRRVAQWDSECDTSNHKETLLSPPACLAIKRM